MKKKYTHIKKKLEFQQNWAQFQLWPASPPAHLTLRVVKFCLLQQTHSTVESQQEESKAGSVHSTPPQYHTHTPLSVCFLLHSPLQGHKDALLLAPKAEAMESPASLFISCFLLTFLPPFLGSSHKMESFTLEHKTQIHTPSASC